MNDYLKLLEQSLPKKNCAICTHLSLVGPNDDYEYDITCVLLDSLPDTSSVCDLFSPTYSDSTEFDIDTMYFNFLESCLKVPLDVYKNSLHFRILKEKTLIKHDYSCSKCSSKNNIDVYHINENLGRENLDDVTVYCNSCKKSIDDCNNSISDESLTNTLIDDFNEDADDYLF